jgi:hypothetical protein
MCHSVRKSFLTALYGIHWDRGEIELNKTLADLGIDDEPEPLLETEKRARVLDLLKARSGVFHPAAYAGRTDSRPRGSEGPGRYFAYNNWDFNTAATILMRETGIDIFEAFDEHFGRPLDMEDWRVSDGYYHYERDKSMYPAYPFRMSARDAARFGLLYASDGVWGDERILSEHWVRRSSALYSIDSDVMGYGFMWWVMREPRFAEHGMFAALGVGNQMIAVLPKSDMVIVNRANTYLGESTPIGELLDLIEQVVDARTGTSVADPALVPLEETTDSLITSVSDTQLSELVGEWEFPPPLLGLSSFTTVDIALDHGHLVLYSPVSGTFRLYLQDDGTLHEEDSHERYIQVRDENGAFRGISDVSSIAIAAVTSATQGRSERAEFVLSLVEGDQSVRVGVARAVVALAGGDNDGADRLLRQVVLRSEPDRVEGDVNAVGYVLMRNQNLEDALRVFELNTRLFPEASNTWDSLGEALMRLGKHDEAIRAYEKSLELDPDNQNAREMINRIRRHTPS